jgi:hypothetical protein
MDFLLVRAVGAPVTVLLLVLQVRAAGWTRCVFLSCVGLMTAARTIFALSKAVLSFDGVCLLPRLGNFS